MGCDIHLYVETKLPGCYQWIAADSWEKSVNGVSCVPYVPYGKGIYEGRDYDLFAILANVRNGCGFAGVKTGTGFVPISMPRGLPLDCSPEVLARSDYYGDNGHSHSHHTVADMLAYDWTQTSTLEGWVDGVTYERWNRTGRHQSPDTYCGGISGSDIKKVSEDEFAELLTKKKFIVDDLAKVYVFATWTQTYYQVASHFLSTVMPVLWRLGKPDEVRIVFWFDN